MDVGRRSGDLYRFGHIGDDLQNSNLHIFFQMFCFFDDAGFLALWESHQTRVCGSSVPHAIEIYFEVIATSPVIHVKLDQFVFGVQASRRI